MDIQFRIANTFADSLASLTGDAQKAVKTTAFDLQPGPRQSEAGLAQPRSGRARRFTL